MHNGSIEELQKRKGFDLTRKDVVLRNCVESELGKHIFDSAFHFKQEKLI